jgi:hypothetical protein
VSLWSTNTLFIPPAFGGSRGTPLIGTFSVAADPPCRADEAAGHAKTANDAKAIEVFDTRSATIIYWNLNVLGEVGSRSADTIKFYVREHSATSLALARDQTETRHVADRA